MNLAAARFTHRCGMKYYLREIEYWLCALIVSLATSINVFFATRDDAWSQITIWITLFLCTAAKVADDLREPSKGVGP